MTEQLTEQPAERAPIVVVYQDGTIKVSSGCTIGEALQALEVARQRILGTVINRSAQ